MAIIYNAHWRWNRKREQLLGAKRFMRNPISGVNDLIWTPSEVAAASLSRRFNFLILIEFVCSV